jgi:hypothetical protein
MREMTVDRFRGPLYLKLRRALAVAAMFGVAPAAVALTGCRSSSGGSTSSGGPASAQSTGGLASGSYQGDGFQVSIPAGWKKVSSAAAATGASGVVFGPPGDTRSSITIHSYRQPTEGIDQTLADVIISDKAEQGSGQMRDVRVQVSPAQVQGATQAKELVESYKGPAGRVRYIDLVALTPSGTMITVEAAAPANTTGFDPASATGSLRITGG